MKRIFSIIFISTFSLLCIAQKNKGEVQLKLKGSWNWLKTEIVDRGGGGIETPQSCSCTKGLTFLDDVVNTYSNDSLKDSFNYYLDEFHNNNNRTQIMIHGKLLTGQIIFWNDTMGIGPFGGCGWIQYFVKNNEK